MIGGVVRHGRTARDAWNLSGHLLKDSDYVEVRNSAADDLNDVMQEMQIARDASRADSAFLHMYLSPSRDMSRDELRQAAEIALKHFDAEGYPAALVFHDKPRRSGEGGSHVHIVVGRVNADGQVLPAGFEKIRLETACRIIEHEMKELPTLGRHHSSAVKWCRNNEREDVAVWLETAYGRKPQKPVSAASPDKRQALERQGVVLGTVRETVRAAWTAADSPKAFAAALAAEGLTVAPGQKPGVFIVRQGEMEIGALDRIMKEKRRDVAERMKGFENVPEGKPERAYEAEAPAGCRERSRKIEAPALAPGRAGAEGRWADRADPARLGSYPPEPATASPQPGRSPRENGRVERAQAVQTLSRVRLSAEATAVASELRAKSTARPVTRHESLSATRQIEASPARRWERIRELADTLWLRARETYDAVVSYRTRLADERRQQDEVKRDPMDEIEEIRRQVRAWKAEQRRREEEASYSYDACDDYEYRPPTPW